VPFVQDDTAMSSKQLALSADNLLSLQMDTYLTLSSSELSGRSAESLPVSRSPAATNVYIANCKPLRRKRRIRIRPVTCQPPSAKPTVVMPVVDSQSYMAAGSIVSVQNCSSETQHNNAGDASCDQLQSDDVDVDEAVCRVDVSRQHSELPRSGSHITRKKAFYKIERPLSIVRRDSSNHTSDECHNRHTS